MNDAPREIVPGLWMLPLRTPTLPPATHTNAYLVGTRDAVLIEPASPWDEEIDKAAHFVGRRVAEGALRLRAMLVTHHHPDHVGGAARLRERLQVPLWGHAATIERLRDRLAFDRALEDGERIELDGPVPSCLEALHTPGHAPGHLCFHELRSDVMVAGDMVASVGTILIEPQDGDMRQYLASLERMRARHPRMLLPAHGEPIEDPEACLTHYIAHRLEREAKVLGALEGRAEARAEDLVPEAYDDAPRAVWPLAALSVEAHLRKLEVEGRAVRTGERWRAR